MAVHTHSQMVNFIWSICNLLRGPYKRNEYRKVILPLTILRRFDAVLEPTKNKALEEGQKLTGKSDQIIQATLPRVTGVKFYNLSPLTFKKLLDDTDQIGPNLTSYINAFSPNVRQIFEKLDFAAQIHRMNEKNLLFQVVKRFAEVDLSPAKIDNIQMGYIFEELIRIGAEQSNEEAGEHFTPREVIKLMVNLLLAPEGDWGKSHVIKKIYDPACGTGGMLSVTEEYMRMMNQHAQPLLFGQDWNDEAYAICRADMLIKGQNEENIKPDCTFEKDGFPKETFDYMLANPPFGVEWKQQQKKITDEHTKLGHNGRFGPGLPRINDGSLLFLLHMLSKRQDPEAGGSRLAIVFNGSPLFTGDAGSGESDIRRWIIENDWLEAVVALPDQLFYNTGISTYIWVLSNHKEERRRGKIQLIDGRDFYVKMRKSLGNKRNQIGDGEENRPHQIAEITKIYGNFQHNETRWLEIDGVEKEVVVSKIFPNAMFGYTKITVERPLRLNFAAVPERINRLSELKGFVKLAQSDKKNEEIRQQEITAGQKRQAELQQLLQKMAELTQGELFKSRPAATQALKKAGQAAGVVLAAAEQKLLLEAIAEKDETAEICTDAKGHPEPDSDLRDTENVPLTEEVATYFAREVLPHVPDAWIDQSKNKVGYEIPLNRHFYRYEPPRPLAEIEAEIKGLEGEIVALLTRVTGRGDGA